MTLRFSSSALPEHYSLTNSTRRSTRGAGSQLALSDEPSLPTSNHGWKSMNRRSAGNLLNSTARLGQQLGLVALRPTSNKRSREHSSTT